eukprot:jgi/Tetstr1/421757/TSEL_012661.t1
MSPKGVRSIIIAAVLLCSTIILVAARNGAADLLVKPGHQFEAAARSPEQPPAHTVSSAANNNSSLASPRDTCAESEPPVTRIKALVLIPGRGPPINGPGVVLIKGGTIEYAGAQEDAPLPADGIKESVIEVEVVMPGLWDCHTHFFGQGTPGMELVQGYSPEKYIHFATALKQLKEALHAGVTSVRELGGFFSQALHRLITSGEVEGPNFHYAGHMIGMTGGHTDEHNLPLSVVAGSSYESYGVMCDGVPECLQAVRANMRLQADVIKVMTSGGVLSLYDQVSDDQFSHGEIAAMVQEAARARRIVAAHAHSRGGIQAAIDAGVFSIEHGSSMSEDQASQIKEKGLIYVPTCTVTQVFNATERPPNIPDVSWRKGKSLLGDHHKAVQRAIKAGVTIVAGTDSPHGCAQVGSEVATLKEFYGMEPLAAIETATGNAPLCLGRLGLAPRSGQLKAGYEADVIALSGNPLVNISVIADASMVTHVWKGGVLYKSPGSPSFGPFQWAFNSAHTF